MNADRIIFPDNHPDDEPMERPLLRDHLMRSGRYVGSHGYINKKTGKWVSTEILYKVSIGHCSKLRATVEHQRRKRS